MNPRSPSCLHTIVLVTSPHAGRARKELPQLQETLAQLDLRVVETIDIHQLVHLRKWLEAPLEARPVVVAAGGDGTVGAVVNYIANTGTILGIIPLGTNNDTARSLGIPHNIKEATRLLVTGKTASVDAALFTPARGEARYFVQAATVGIQVAFARLATNVSRRRRFGRFIYAVATASALRTRKPFCCTLIMNDEQGSLSLLYLAVINAPMFGGALELHLANSSIENRRLGVLAVKEAPLYRLLFALLPLVWGKRPWGHSMRVFHVPWIEVQADQAYGVALDGEIGQRIPGKFTIAPEALRVITPRDFKDIHDKPV